MKHVVPGFNPAILQQPLQLPLHVLVYSICSKHLVTKYGAAVIGMISTAVNNAIQKLSVALIYPTRVFA